MSHLVRVEDINVLLSLLQFGMRDRCNIYTLSHILNVERLLSYQEDPTKEDPTKRETLS